MMLSRQLCISLLLLSFASLSCSTAKAPDSDVDLDKQGPCAGSWNLRYERLVGDKCYRKRLERAAEAGCKAGDRTSCEVARAVTSFSGTSLEPSDVAAAATAGCKAGDADGCAIQAMELLEEHADRAEKVFSRGCKLGSVASCFELARLTGEESSDEQAVSCSPEAPAKCRQDACRRGHAASCRMLGSFAERGEHLERNLGSAVAFYEKACARGDGVGCGELGRFYAQGRVVPRQSKVARALFEWGCGGGNADACLHAAQMHAEGFGGARSFESAGRLYSSACRAGNGAGCRELAVLYQKTSHQNAGATDAASLFAEACEKGDGQGCAKLAEIEIAEKENGAKAVARIRSLYEKACNAGFEDGCIKGAYRFGTGDGVPKDERASAELSAKACKLGSAPLCWGAADAYRFGYGVESDAKAATRLISRGIELYRKDCKKGDARACKMAAHAIAHGYPEKKKRLEQARKYLESACEDGSTGACQEIAIQRITGEIYAVDREWALQEMQQRCDKGEDRMCIRLANEWSIGGRTDRERALGGGKHQSRCAWRRDRDSCVQLSRHYLRGHGMERDAEAAYNVALRVCDDDDTTTCGVAGVALLRQKPKKEDAEESDDAKPSLVKRLQKQCVYEGDDSLCTPLARMHESGYQLDKEPYRALSLYERVCEADVELNSEACSRASLVRLAKKAKDLAKQTPKKLDKACEGGDAKSCVMLARHHEFGSFDADRFRQAIPAYRKACEHGNADACTLYVTLAFEEGTSWGPRFFDEVQWACEKGTAEMCHQWGEVVGKHDWDAVVSLNQKACAKGREQSCRFLQENLEALPERGE